MLPCIELRPDSPGVTQNGTVAASNSKPARLAVHIKPEFRAGGRRMTEAYADVLAAGASLDDEPRRHTYLRRFTATEEQRAAGSFEILFDGRDGNGEVLPAGVYRVSVVVRSSGSDSCDDPSWGAPGLISTVDWRP